MKYKGYYEVFEIRDLPKKEYSELEKLFKEEITDKGRTNKIEHWHNSTLAWMGVVFKDYWEEHNICPKTCKYIRELNEKYKKLLPSGIGV